MHAIILFLQFGTSISTFVFALSFIIFLEFHNRAAGFIATMETPGWRGVVPSIFFVGSILSAFTSALATLLLNFI